MFQILLLVVLLVGLGLWGFWAVRIHDREEEYEFRVRSFVTWVNDAEREADGRGLSDRVRSLAREAFEHAPAFPSGRMGSKSHLATVSAFRSLERLRKICARFVCDDIAFDESFAGEVFGFFSRSDLLPKNDPEFPDPAWMVRHLAFEIETGFVERSSRWGSVGRTLAFVEGRLPADDVLFSDLYPVLSGLVLDLDAPGLSIDSFGRLLSSEHGEIRMIGRRGLESFSSGEFGPEVVARAERELQKHAGAS